MNDENTMLMNSENETSKSDALQTAKPVKDNGWQKVMIGGVAGIMLGVGGVAAYAKHQGNEADQTLQQAEKPENVANAETTPQKEAMAQQSVKATEASDDMSFSEAFAEARSEVGPGGVFHWHGGLYGTYTEAEWNAMSDADKQEFTERAKAEMRTGEDNPDVYAQNASHPADDSADVVVADNQDPNAPEEVAAVDNSAEEGSDDVHVVGYGQTEGGNDVALLDVDGNGSTDVAIIDAGGEGELTPDDVVVDAEGNSATVADLIEQSEEGNVPDDDPSLLQASNEDPLSPDMPDYMNDADVNMMA